jgi:hypothetical protein
MSDQPRDPRDQPIDPRLVEQTRQHIRQLVAEINQLSGSDIPPQQFFGEFLQRVVAAVAAVGGAVWSREGNHPPRLQHQVNFLMSGLLDEQAGASGHSALLMGAFGNGDAKLIPPHSGTGPDAERNGGANSSDWALLVSPLQVDKHTLGVVELLMDPTRRPSALQNAVRFVEELCEIGAGYLKNRQLRQMLSQQHLWSQLEQFVKQIHTSLTPKEVSFIVANEGKRLVGCDRLSVALIYGRKAVIEGVSGQEVIERKSNLIKLMTHLVRTVIASNENLLYTGEARDDLPPAVRDSLDDYLAESGTKVLAVTLLRTIDKEGTAQKPFGALVGEQLEDASAPETLTPKMEVVGQHGAIALSNALAHHRVFMLPVWRAVGNATSFLRGSRLWKTAIALGGLAAITLAMVLFTWELRMEGRGNLLPRNRRNLYSSENAIVKRVEFEHAQIVDIGQPLLTMTSPELDQQLKELQRQKNEAEKKYDQLITGRDVRPDIAIERAIAEAALESLKQQIQIVEERLDKLTIRAPMSGMMVRPFDPPQMLGNLPVKVGQMLAVVAQVDGTDWVLEVKMPEHKIGHILRAEESRRQADDPTPLSVRFILANHPQKSFRGHVEKIETQAEFDKDLNEHVLRIRVVPEGVVAVHATIVPLDEQAGTREVKQLEMEFENGDRVKLAHGTEVHAKVECGKKSMGYVLLRVLIEFFYETILF